MKSFSWRAMVSTVAVCALYAGGASANENFSDTATFDSMGALTASALSATIASSSISFQPSSVVTMGGNQVKNVFNGSTGVMGIVQNSGIGSNVQQSIVVKVDNLPASITH